MNARYFTCAAALLLVLAAAAQARDISGRVEAPLRADPASGLETTTKRSMPNWDDVQDIISVSVDERLSAFKELGTTVPKVDLGASLLELGAERPSTVRTQKLQQPKIPEFTSVGIL